MHIPNTNLRRLQGLFASLPANRYPLRSEAHRASTATEDAPAARYEFFNPEHPPSYGGPLVDQLAPRDHFLMRQNILIFAPNCSFHGLRQHLAHSTGLQPSQINTMYYWMPSRRRLLRVVEYNVRNKHIGSSAFYLGRPKGGL